MEVSIDKAYTIISEKLQNWFHDFVAMLPNLMMALLILVIFNLVARVLKKLVRKLISKISDNPNLHRLFGSLVFLIVMTIGIFTALSVLNLDKALTSLLAGAGILGLALGFAFQDIAANFMSGVMIAVRRPIKINDVITTQSFTGTVIKIDLRNTTLLTFDGLNVIIPNKEVFQNAMINFSTNGRRRVEIIVGVSYAEDLPTVKKLIIETLAQLPYAEDIRCNATEFADSSINFFVTFFVPFPSTEVNFLEAKGDAIMLIKQAFDQAGITIPFPIRTLDFGIKGGIPLSEMTK